jgi:hypothetical protein
MLTHARSYALQDWPSGSSLPVRLRAWEEDLRAEGGKISSCFCCLHRRAMLGGQNLKIGQRYGTPQWRRHAVTLANLLIPMHREESCL